MKQKLKQFQELATFNRVFQPNIKDLKQSFKHKGNWAKNVFQNSNPLVLELGCGKGEYTIELASKIPAKNYIGVDIKGNRLWRGAKTGHEENIVNAAFLRTQIEFIEYFFAGNEVSEIWITFPDPQIKERRTEKRLTHPIFLEKYHHILNPNGIVHLKTDSDELYEYSKHSFANEKRGKIVNDTFDVHAQDEKRDEWLIETFYEKMFKKEGKPIHYIQFQFD